jgi:hypothetical protein
VGCNGAAITIRPARTVRIGITAAYTGGRPKIQVNN